MKPALFLVLLAVLACAAPAAAQQPEPAAGPKSFSSRAEPSTVRLGQPFVLEVVITGEPSVLYTLPKDLELGTLDVRRVDVQRVEQGAEAVTTARIEVALFDAVGPAQLPTVIFEAHGPFGRTSLAVPGPPIQVEATAEGEELDDIGGPQMLAVFSPAAIWIALGAALLAAAAYFGVRGYRRRRAARPAAPVHVGTPEERALAALDALEAEGFNDEGRAFYFSLSEIVRGFLEEVGQLNAREMTTRELVDALVAREVPGLSLAQLGSWLERGDLHRFARIAATHEGAAQDVEKARAMIRSVAAALRPEPSVTTEEAA